MVDGGGSLRLRWRKPHNPRIVRGAAGGTGELCLIGEVQDATVAEIYVRHSGGFYWRVLSGGGLEFKPGPASQGRKFADGNATDQDSAVMAIIGAMVLGL